MTSHSANVDSKSTSFLAALAIATIMTVIGWLGANVAVIIGLVTLTSLPMGLLFFFLSGYFFGEHIEAALKFFGVTNEWGAFVVSYAIGLWSGTLINAYYFLRRSANSVSHPPPE